MERKCPGHCGAPKKLELSFSIEEILKRPTESSRMVKTEGAGGQDTRQAAGVSSGLERPPQAQPQGKCLLVISLPLLDPQEPAGLRQRKSCSLSKGRTPKFKERSGAGPIT